MPVLQVLKHLAQAPGGLTSEEVAALLGKSRATATYLLNSLCSEGFADRDVGDGRYRLAATHPTRRTPTHHPGACALPVDDLRVAVEELYSRTGARAYLALSDGDRVVIDETRGRQGLPLVPGLSPTITGEAHALANRQGVPGSTRATRRPGSRLSEEKIARYGSTGVKLYTAEWRGDSKGWSLRDPWAQRYLAKAQDLGVRNVHVHKGPTIWPLNKDAFNVDDVDDAATAFPELTFVVEHVGLPRLEDFCWIGVQEPNVYGGLAVAMPFMETRPRYFAKIIGELLYWLGEDRILFASDYAIWQPKWLVEQFVDFEMPEDMVPEYGEVTDDMKRKILGLNAAALYDLDVPDDLRLPDDGGTGMEVSDKPAVDTTA